MHLAQFNAAKLNYPLSHSSMREFVENLTRINDLARASRGFVWKLQDDTGHSAYIRTDENPDMTVNLSVWESLESLNHFLWYSEHRYFYSNRRQWFQKPKDAHSVLWWVAPGTVPSLEQAWEKLTFLRTHGVTPAAFTFSCPYSADGYRI